MTTDSAISWFRSLPDGDQKDPFLEYLRSFEDPGSVAGELRDLLESDDDLVAPPETFFETPSSNLFEEWTHPVNARSIHETEEGRLLCLPPGSDRFRTYRERIPSVIEDQLRTCFPRLKAELANRPNLFFQGVFYPDEITIRSMEMISLHHGRNYVVRCNLKLRGIAEPRTVVLKPTSMGVEAGISSLLDELNRRMSPDLRGRVGPIRTPSIVSVDGRYGILEYLPGRNGVEVLPRGINTGSIHALKSNEYPDGLDLTSEGLIRVVDEFAKQAALAYYLRIYDRKPDQMMFGEDGPGRYEISHIDFGRGLKKNFALPWKRYYATQRAPLVFRDYQIPYFEAAASLIFLPHFIPGDLRDEYDPYSGILRRRIHRTFVELGYFFKQNAGIIREHLEALVGQKTQFRESEVDTRAVTEADLREVNETLRSFDPKPEEICENIINLARAERIGGAPTENPSGERDDTIYGRGVRSGKASRRLVDRKKGPEGYHLRDYKAGGKVYYDHEDQVLRVDFGPAPQTIIDYVYWHYAPRLAEFFETFASIEPETRAVVQLDGQSRITIPPGFVRRDVNFPRESLDEVRRVARGFAAPDHLEEHLQQFSHWKKNHPDADYLRTETQRHKKIFEANMDGKEILQWYERTTDEESPVGTAIEEVIHHLLSNPDYLSDKDPLKSINSLVVNLGHKHEFISPLTPDEFRVPDPLEELFGFCRTFYNRKIPVGFFEERTPQHLSHIKIMLRLTDLVLEASDLSRGEDHLLRAAALLHNLGLRDENFASLLMNPNNRLDRPVFERILRNHPSLAGGAFEEFREAGDLTVPGDLDEQRLSELLTNHHRYWQEHREPSRPGDRRLHERLHLIDNLAVFADQTRPDYWAKGYFRLTDLAPRWIGSQHENGLIGDRLHERMHQMIENRPEALNNAGREARHFVELHNALQLARMLEEGLNPQNPHMVRQLRDRHGKTLVNSLWFRILESDLPADEKVKVLRRLDELGSLFGGRDPTEYVFLNGSPRPVQRTVDRIEQSLENGKKVILTGLFPRVTEAFERYLDTAEVDEETIHDRVLAVAGKHRLQFIRHSYPYEAEFERPFHRIIEDYRARTDPSTSLCLIPFAEFYRGFSPVTDPATRVRELEKASSVEEHSAPERVLNEARRFNRETAGNVDFDGEENNRFRRILLNDFSNREILYFYRETLDGHPGTTDALQEVIGALWENPNYLSERESRYAIHELVRSLSQIHFYEGSRARARDRIHRRLDEHGVEDREVYDRILDRMGSELNFFKNTLGRALSHYEVISGTDAASPGVVYLILSAGLLADDETWRDYLLSPEDVSYNRILRRQLRRHTPDLTERVLNSDRLNALPPDVRDRVVSWVEDPHNKTYGLTQVSVYLSLAVDFSRVENWERGHRRILPQDLNHFLDPFEELLQDVTGESLAREVTATVREREDALLRSLNDHAESTNPYVSLFNALTFASELRYGLFPGAVNSLDNVRELYGTRPVNKLLDGIVNSDLSALESLKFSRKIRYLASALNKFDGATEEVRILNLDRSGTWSLSGDGVDEGDLVILTGELSNARSFWESVQDENPSVAARCYCLIGEEYPLLIKETTLSRTEELREVVTDCREGRSRTGQYLLVPARAILEPLTGSTSHGPTRTVPDPHSLFFDAWLELFESD